MSSDSPYGDGVHTKAHINPRTIYAADDDNFWCGQSLEYGETIDTPTFTSCVICLRI